METNTITISVDQSVAEQLQQAAAWTGIDLHQAAQEALVEYIRQRSRQKIERESRSFDEMRAELLAQYRGQYVAIHNGQVVAHAPDLRSLHREVFARFGETPILHKRVSDESELEIRTHGLRFDHDTR